MVKRGGDGQNKGWRGGFQWFPTISQRTSQRSIHVTLGVNQAKEVMLRHRFQRSAVSFDVERT